MSQNPSNRQSDGFTIVEILIATTVLSVILVLVSSMMIGIGKLYYKGINQSRVQDTVRTITDEVAQQIQLTDAVPFPKAGNNYQRICIGTFRYSFILDKLAGETDATGNPYKHVMWRDTNPDPGNCDSTPNDFLNTNIPSPDGVELMSANSRLSAFAVTNLPQGVKIEVGVIFANGTDLYTAAGIDSTCNGGAGDQFCATGHLTTVAAKRL